MSDRDRRRLQKAHSRCSKKSVADGAPRLTIAAMQPDPNAIELIADRVRATAAAGTTLRIRGGGSKDFYGEALQGDVLDTAPLAGVLAYEPSELVITAGAGTPLRELDALLAANGQCLPFDPPHFGTTSATVGGMVACGLSGPARANVGAVRDYVLGLKLINGRGEHLTFGGQVMKNVAGYDVSRLMAGAMGTLGLLTEVSLKVLPVAPGEATLRFECTQAQALNWLHSWGAQPLPLNASCWVSESGATSAGVLYLRLRGAVAAVESACKALGGERNNNVEVAADWQSCRDHKLPWFKARSASQDLWRLSVPQTTPVLDLPDTPLIEWHGGQRWVRAEAGQAQALRALAASVGGHATLFIANGDRNTGAAARFDTLKPSLERIHRKLKHEFDPAGVFNPHRLSLDW